MAKACTTWCGSRFAALHDDAIARAVGKSVVNSPLLQCAICGNDPNVGRLVMAIGKEVGARGLTIDPVRMSLRMGGRSIFARGSFTLDHDTEAALKAHLRAAELYASAPPVDGVFTPPVDYPPHQRRVEIEVELGQGFRARPRWSAPTARTNTSPRTPTTAAEAAHEGRNSSSCTRPRAPAGVGAP